MAQRSRPHCRQPPRTPAVVTHANRSQQMPTTCPRPSAARRRRARASAGRPLYVRFPILENALLENRGWMCQIR
eukprot:2019561-Lingulodinium_polyedra.AAC.1